MLYDLINPSDPYTLESDSFAAACVAACLIGSGQYGLKPRSGSDDEMPLFLFGGHNEWFVEHFGTNFADTLQAIGLDAIADVLDTLLVGGMGERTLFQTTVQFVDDPARRAQLRRQFNRSKAGSINDIAGRADQLSREIREQAKDKTDER